MTLVGAVHAWDWLWWKLTPLHIPNRLLVNINFDPRPEYRERWVSRIKLNKSTAYVIRKPWPARRRSILVAIADDWRHPTDGDRDVLTEPQP